MLAPYLLIYASHTDKPVLKRVQPAKRSEGTHSA